MVAIPCLTSLAGIVYFLGMPAPSVDPIILPLNQVTSLSSTGPRESIRSFPSQFSGIVIVLLYQAKPSNSGKPLFSHGPGRDTLSHSSSGNEGFAATASSP